MKKTILTLILVLVLIFACSCTQIAKEAYVVCPQCGADLDIATDSNDYPPRYSDDNSICPDCVVKDVIDWIEKDYVCIDREDWKKFYEQYGDTDAYAKAEAGSVSFSYPSYYDIQEWLSED